MTGLWEGKASCRVSAGTRGWRGLSRVRHARLQGEDTHEEALPGKPFLTVLTGLTTAQLPFPADSEAAGAMTLAFQLQKREKQICVVYKPPVYRVTAAPTD